MKNGDSVTAGECGYQQTSLLLWYKPKEKKPIGPRGSLHSDDSGLQILQLVQQPQRISVLSSQDTSFYFYCTWKNIAAVQKVLEVDTVFIMIITESLSENLSTTLLLP